MMNDLRAISKKLYLFIVKPRGVGELGNKKIGIGTNSQILEIKSSKVKDITRILHYALYKGRCLEPEKLSYIISEKTLAEGDMTVEEIRNL